MKQSMFALAIFLGLAITIPAFAQCSGFAHIGTMARTTNGLEVKEYVQIAVPADLDRSYHQPSPSGRGGRAGSTLPQETIPAGICIEPNGLGSYGWAVSNPVMINPTTFQMYLYCSQDQAVFNTQFGCSVSVDVYVKTVGTTVGSTPSGTMTKSPETDYKRGSDIMRSLGGKPFGCVCVGSLRAPAQIRIYQEDKQGGNGAPVYSGSIARGQKIHAQTYTGRLRYEYRYRDGDSWSPSTGVWCGSGTTVEMP